MLSKRLIAADASPAAILAAGRSWQSAVTRDLPSAASQAVERVGPSSRCCARSAPCCRCRRRCARRRTDAVAASLATESDSLLARLRRLASPAGARDPAGRHPGAAASARRASPPPRSRGPRRRPADRDASVRGPRATARRRPFPTTGATNPTAPQASSGPVPAPTLPWAPGAAAAAVDARPADRRRHAGRRARPDGRRRAQRARPRRIATAHGSARPAADDRGQAGQRLAAGSEVAAVPERARPPGSAGRRRPPPAGSGPNAVGTSIPKSAADPRRPEHQLDRVGRRPARPRRAPPAHAAERRGSASTPGLASSTRSSAPRASLGGEPGDQRAVAVTENRDVLQPGGGRAQPGDESLQLLRSGFRPTHR